MYVSAHSLLHNPRVTDEVDHKIHCAEAANTLWDVPLSDVYEKLQERSLDLNLDSFGLAHDPHLESVCDKVKDICADACYEVSFNLQFVEEHDITAFPTP